MDCSEARELIPLALDHELDARGEVGLETHLAGCAACRARYEAAAALRAAVRREATHYRAPAALRARLSVAPAGAIPAPLPAAAPPAPVRRKPEAGARPRAWPWAGNASLGWRLFNGGGFAAALAAMLVLVIALPQRPPASDRLADDAIADHARAVLTDHLTDVLSSDQHTVKPWFAGRLDYSPPVHDLVDAGFPLVGGRLDYLDHRAVATLVYRRHQHLIDVFVWPAAAADAPSKPALRSDRGWHVLAWSTGGLAYRAVSDVEPGDLQQLATLLDPAARGR
jgi:anti-sigma factor (TIGR02949 family)